MNPQAINRRSFIGGLAAIPAAAIVGPPKAQHAAPEMSGCSGSYLFQAGGRYWCQVWQDRDDIAPGFRIGTVRQLG